MKILLALATLVAALTVATAGFAAADESTAVISSGLDAGETVICEAKSVKPGTRVRALPPA